MFSSVDENIVVGSYVRFIEDLKDYKWYDTIIRKVVSINNEWATLNPSFEARGYTKIHLGALKLVDSDKDKFENFYNENV